MLSPSLLQDLPYQRSNGVTYTDVIATRDGAHLITPIMIFLSMVLSLTLLVTDLIGEYLLRCNGPACMSPGYHLYMITCDQNNNNCADGYDTGTNTEVVGSSVGQPTCWDNDHVTLSRGFVSYYNYSDLCGSGDVTSGSLYGPVPPPPRYNAFTLLHELPYQRSNGVTYTDVIATRDILHTYYAYYDIPVNGSIPDIARYGFDWGISFGCNGPACMSPGYHLYMITCDQHNNNCVDAYDTGTNTEVVGSSVGQPTCWDNDHVALSRDFVWYYDYVGLCGVGDVTAGSLFPANYGRLFGNFDHFEITYENGGAIYDKAVGQQFTIKITALNADGTVKTGLNGNIDISAPGRISPSTAWRPEWFERCQCQTLPEWNQHYYFGKWRWNERDEQSL